MKKIIALIVILLSLFLLSCDVPNATVIVHNPPTVGGTHTYVNGDSAITVIVPEVGTTVTNPGTTTVTSTVTTTVISTATVTTTLPPPTTTTTTPSVPTPIQIESYNGNNGWTVCYAFQRKVFQMAGLWWVFYADGQNIIYQTSADAQTWSGRMVLIPGSYQGQAFAGYFDGTYFYYALTGSWTGANLYYRKGIPNQWGAFEWSAAQQFVFSPGDGEVMYPNIIADTNGYPWIGFVHKSSGFPNNPAKGYVIKSSASDGTWVNATGFPVNITGDNSANLPTIIGAPMLDGKTYWIYSATSATPTTLKGRIWDGAWQPEETIANSSWTASSTLAAYGDTIHATFFSAQGTSWVLNYKNRIDGVWGNDHVVASLLSFQQPILTIFDDNNLRVCFAFGETKHIWYQKMVNGSWEAPVDYVGEYETFAYGINFNGNIYGDTTLLLYVTGDSQYRIKVLKVN